MLLCTSLKPAVPHFGLNEQEPITLPPGEETLNLTVRFAPTSDGSVTAPEETTGTITVASNDPSGNLAGALCGEAVAGFGGRWLVVNGANTPINGVDQITLTSSGINMPSPYWLRLRDVPVSTATICGNTVNYHVQQEDMPSTSTTGSNPKSSYSFKAKEGNKQLTKDSTLAVT